MAINEYHLSKESVSSVVLADEAVTRPKVDDQFIQSGSALLNLGFAAAGVETVNVTVAFAAAFPSGVSPRVIICPRDILAITWAVTSISNTGFTFSASDNVGTDYTTSQSLRIDFIAIAP